MKRFKKRYIISGAVVLLFVLVLFFLSPITKNYLVKNSETLIGRKMDIAGLHFNYLNMTVKASSVVLYEADKTSHFVAFRELFVDFAPWKLFKNEYSFSKISIDSLQANIVQTDSGFNFNDLIPAEDSAVAPTDTTAADLKFSIHNISLTRGNLKYTDQPLNNEVEIRNLNLELPLIAWNRNQSDMGAKFNIGEQGTVEVAAMVDNQKNSYEVNVKTNGVSIQPIAVYLKDYADIGTLDGLLTSEIKIGGDMVDFMNVTVSGVAKVNDLRVSDSRLEEIAAAGEIRANIKEISLKTYHFGFTGITLDQPRVSVVRDKEKTNLERFLLPYFATDSTENPAEIVVSDESGVTEQPETSYEIDTLQINGGQVSLADNTLSRASVTTVSDLNMTLLGLTANAGRVPVSFSAHINESGIFSGKTVFSMTEPKNFEFDGEIKQLDLVRFSPYSEFYITSPVTQGWFNYGIKVKMDTRRLESQNNIKIRELEFGKKTSDKAVLKVPLRLGLYIIKDINDNITIDMPVTGSTSDPQFKPGKLIWKTFTNLMIKTAASPLNALAGLAGTNPEKLEYLPFAFAQDSLDQSQISTLTSLAGILNKKTELAVVMIQRTDETAEKNELAVKIVKEKYQAEKQQAAFPGNNDEGFLEYLRQQVPEMDSMGIERACLQLTTPEGVENEFKTLLARRNQLVRQFFLEQGLPEESVHVSTADFKTLPLELRRPEYKVEVLMK